MIENEAQRQIAVAQAGKFAGAVANFGKGKIVSLGVDPRIADAMLDGLKSQLKSLDDEIAEYDLRRCTHEDAILLTAIARCRLLTPLDRVSAAQYADWFKELLEFRAKVKKGNRL